MHKLTLVVSMVVLWLSNQCLWDTNEGEKRSISQAQTPPVAISTLIFNRLRGDLAAILQSWSALRLQIAAMSHRFDFVAIAILNFCDLGI